MKRIWAVIYIPIPTPNNSTDFTLRLLVTRMLFYKRYVLISQMLHNHIRNCHKIHMLTLQSTKYTYLDISLSVYIHTKISCYVMLSPCLWCGYGYECHSSGYGYIYIYIYIYTYTHIYIYTHMYIYI